jgi:ABC-type polysaccharide/polyol phosphate transport system ATPase subunit
METTRQGQPETRAGTRAQPVVDLRGVRKKFVILRQKPFLARDLVRRLLFRRPVREEFWALKGVDLTVQAGEAVALVGRNGAGKSTVLEVVAGTIHPTEGTVRVTGRVAALLDLGAGFHADLTGRENIYLNASIFGLSRRDVDERFDAIVAFAELGEFIDFPLRGYSSGMVLRLGFAVAAHVDAEVLLVDEVLAVGDERFQQKCLARIQKFRAEGRTLVFVSHALDQVKSLCDRAVWIDHGVVRADGSAAEIVARYLSEG